MTKVFYNASNYKNTSNKEVKAFLEYLTTKKPVSDFTQSLQKNVSISKGNKHWRKNYMAHTTKYDELRKEVLTEGKNKKC